MTCLSVAVLVAAALLAAHLVQEPRVHLLRAMSLCHGALVDLGEALAAPEEVLEVDLAEAPGGDAAAAGADVKPPMIQAL